MTIVAKSDAYAVCGSPTYKAAEVQDAINEVIDMIMQRRTTNWVWDEISIIPTIQVAAPKKLIGRGKTIQSVNALVKDNWDYLDRIDIAELAFVARSLCLDPRRLGGHDLLSSIHDSMSTFLSNETDALETDHVFDFALLLSALCINDYPIDPRLVNGLLNLQNDDGSFGPGQNAAEATIFMLRPVFCISQMKNTQFNVTEVKDTVKGMRNFIFTKVSKPHPKSMKVFIGPTAITSTNALVALYKTILPGEDPDILWRCREVMDTLGLKALDSYDEDDLQEHLRRLTATDFLDLQKSQYECLDSKDLDPMPTGYQPTCDYEKPETCGMNLPSDTPK